MSAIFTGMVVLAPCACLMYTVFGDHAVSVSFARPIPRASLHVFVDQRMINAAAQAGFMFPGCGYEAVPWYDQFGEFASKNPGGLAQVGFSLAC